MANPIVTIEMENGKKIVAELYPEIAPETVRLQSAWGVCRAAEGREPKSAAELLPVYLRLSQAERERQMRMEKIIR